MLRDFEFPGLASVVRAFTVALLVVTSSSAWGQLPVPTLNTVYPPGGKQGTSLDLAVAGQNLDDGEKLVFTHPGITAQPKMSPPTEFRPTAAKIPDQYTMTIAADVPPGTYEVRHLGRYGLSNPRAFVVGTLNEVAKAGGNQKPENAQEVPPGSTLTGRVDANNIDYYALPLKAGQHILLDCWAQRIDSRMNGTLIVSGPDGRELARSRDVEGRDPVLDFTAPADGRYLVSVYDFVYGGGAEYFYRLNLTAAPHIDFIFPPSGPAGSNNQYTVYGRNLPGGQPAEGLAVKGQPLQKLTVNIAIPADELARTQAAIVAPARPATVMVDGVEFKLSSPAGNSNLESVGVAQAPMVVEQEPNDANVPQKITVPCEYVGQFYPQRDHDWVQFDAKKGDVYFLEVIAHRLGRNCDPSLLIQRVTKNDKGEEQIADVAQVDDAPDRNARMGSDFDTSSDDPSYKLTVPDDGTYRVGLRDNFGDGRKDPRFVYRLIIRKPEPDFRVAVYPDVPGVGNQDQNQVRMDTFVIHKGGATMLRVVAERRDEFQGDITVTLEGLPAGVTSSGAVLGGNVTTGTLVLTATDAAAAWTGPVKVVAKAKVNDQEKTRLARIGTVVWGTQNRQQTPPYYRAMRDLVLCVADKEPERVSLQIGDGNVIETALGGKIELPVKVVRRGELKDPLKLVQIGLPNELKPKDLTINNGQNDGKLELEVNNQNVKLGTYTFCMKADSKINYARNPESVTAAEAEKKQLEEAIAAFTEKLKQATAARDQANKAAQETKTAAQQAEQLKNQAAQEVQQKQDAEKKAAEEKLAAADKALAEAQAKAKAAEDARVKAEQEVKQFDDKVKQGQQLKQQFDQRFNNIKNLAQPKDIGVSFISTPIKLRIHASPIKVEVPPPAQAAKAGMKTEVPVNIVRMFNFNEPVEVTLEPPSGVPGLPAVKATIPAGQTAGKAELTPQNNAPAGDHVFNVKARGKFGNVNFETVGQVTIKVEAAPQK
jgi:multidrug efflux pump subunit AcrA (membrane-fusion protein)